MIVSFLRVADGVLWVALTSMRSIAVWGWWTSWNQSTRMLRKRDKAAGRQRLLLRLGSFECFVGDVWSGAPRVVSLACVQWFPWHAWSGMVLFIQKCTDVAHRHMRYGYVLGYALAVEVRYPKLLQNAPHGYTISTMVILCKQGPM